jgi:GNAT superfamily N-acetyltransferase
MTLFTDTGAGPSAYLGGIAVLPQWRGLGVEGWLASEALMAAFSAGATLGHFNPDEDDRVWALDLGFVEVPGFLVRVVRAD